MVYINIYVYTKTAQRKRDVRLYICVFVLLLKCIICLRIMGLRHSYTQIYIAFAFGSTNIRGVIIFFIKLFTRLFGRNFVRKN